MITGLWTSYHLVLEFLYRGIVSAASTAVSKTVRPGSNPGTPANNLSAGLC